MACVAELRTAAVPISRRVPRVRRTAATRSSSPSVSSSSSSSPAREVDGETVTIPRRRRHGRRDGRSTSASSMTSDPECPSLSQRAGTKAFCGVGVRRRYPCVVYRPYRRRRRRLFLGSVDATPRPVSGDSTERRRRHGGRLRQRRQSPEKAENRN